MPRRRRSLALSAEAAQAALSFLVQEGKVAASEVQKALQRREKLVRELREKLASLGVEGLKVARRARKSAIAQAKAAEKTSRPARKRVSREISAATRKLYQAQGRYMAALRPLAKGARKKIKAIRAKSGIEAAIKEAISLYR